MPSHFDLPFQRAILRLGGKDNPNETMSWYDVKFYPYTAPGVDPIFAVVGDRHVVVCRCVERKDSAIDIIRWFSDDNANAKINSLEWSRAENGDPLLCVSGIWAGINIINVKTGEVVKTLIGHGDAINDLAISPVSPLILASGSADHSIRVWSLDEAHKKNPTTVKCAGSGGHNNVVLTLAWHRTGRYILSGGMDTMVNMWVIPELPNEDTGGDSSTVIHYPHFSTTELHIDFVDCVRFYNDLILSRAVKEDKILLWRIDNFTSSTPPPPPSSVPIPRSQASSLSTHPNGSHPNPTTTQTSTGLRTRSAWNGRFQRLLQFELPQSSLFYLRFSLFHEARHNPVLVAGNANSKLFIWDLKKLEDAAAENDTGFKIPGKRKQAGKERGGPAYIRQSSEVSTASSGVQSLATSAATSAEGQEARGKGKTEERQGVGDPFNLIKAHKTVMVPKVSFAVRQIAWSRGGEWCVACGDNGMITMLRRWEDGFPE